MGFPNKFVLLFWCSFALSLGTGGFSFQLEE